MGKIKKIAIVNPHMKIGGIASSLQNWAKYLSERKDLEIDYYIFDKDFDGKYKDFGKDYNVIYPSFSNKSFLNPKGSFIKDLVFKILMKLGIISKIKYNLTLNYKVRKKYDLAISYSNDIPRFNNNLMSNDFVQNSLNADYKVAWIHNDIDKLGFTKGYTINRYKKFDAIVNVSKACKNQFDNLVPEFKNKSFVVSNAMDIDYIFKQSCESLDLSFNDKILNFITVARIYNDQKRIDRILDIVERLKKDKLEFHWYIVGDGVDLEWLKNDSIKRGLETHLTFLGFKSNPYPYIKKSDYFVLTSDYEAQGMVLTEALCLGKPVISTNFEAVNEFVVNAKNGYILEKSVESFYCLLRELIHSNKKMNSKEFVYKNYEEDFNILLNFLNK